MTTGDSAGLEVALQAVLARHPDAPVAAVGVEGLFVDLPSSLPLESHPRVQGRAATDLTDATDVVTVINAWEQAKVDGAGTARVRLAGDGGQATLHLVDVRAHHGVFVLVVVPESNSWTQATDTVVTEEIQPRMARTRKDDVAIFTDTDEGMTELLGWQRDELIGHRSLDFIHPDDQQQAVDGWLDLLATPDVTTRTRLRHAHRDGRWIWMEISNRNRLHQDGCGYVDSELLDISAEVEANTALRASEQLLRRLASALPVGVLHIAPDRSIRYANRRIAEIFGVDPDAESPHLLARIREQAELGNALDTVLAGSDIDVTVRLDRVDGGGPRRCHLSLRSLTTDTGEAAGAVGCLTDVTESARLREELEHRATVDALTGCLNRSSVIAELEGLLSARIDVAVVFVDLDDFKAVNDSLGHAAGDALLTRTVSCLNSAKRFGDIIGRVGGDEFLILCPNIGGVDTAGALGERIAERCAVPCQSGPNEVSTAASVGVAWAPANQKMGADELVGRADAAMYTAKAQGGGRAVMAATWDCQETTSPEAR